jgi:tetratricopeptide (TPR) repeat protein
MNRHQATNKALTPMRAAPATPRETRVMHLRHADVYRKLGDYPIAELIVKELLASIENSLNPDDTEVAIALTKLGLLCVDQGKYVEAKAYYQRALNIMDNSHGPGLSDNLPPPNTQAHSENPEEFYPPSEVVYQRLLAFLARRAGHEQLSVAIVLRDLADLYRRQGNFDGAATYYDYALAILRTTLGADHPEYRFTNESYVSMQREQVRAPLKDS